MVTEPVYSLKEIDQPPTPVSQQAAAYPRTLRTQRLEGSVVVGFTITSKGVVLDPHAVSSTNEGFEQAAIDAVNEPLAQYERLKAFAIIVEDFSVQSGELTPTFKVKRRVIEDRYAALITRLYS